MSDRFEWIFPERPPVPDDFQSAIGGHPLVAETLYHRGYRTVESALAFLHPENYQPTPASQLPDIETAIQILIDAIKQQKHILVWGDFDADGQTSTTLLVEGLRELGGFVSYHIPIRGDESHGISLPVLEKYLAESFDLLLTCDTGISEHENVQFLRNAGIPVIITDHHSLGKTLPAANAVINPQRLPKDHPLHTLPGVGVAYKLIEALFQAMSLPFDQGHYTELAALGIVSDVAKLQGDARYLLQKGLESLQQTNRIGLQTLYKSANLKPLNIAESHIAFQIAPRMNAVGRLGDANVMVEFLTTKDSGRARVLGMQIEAMNAKRRFYTRQVEQAAETLLQMSPNDRHAAAIVLHHQDWPGGVVGIVASRLVERYQKPVVLLTGQGPIHGSARSVDGLNITEAIAAQSEHLLTYGGHPMAAGLSMEPGNFSAFKKGFLSVVEKSLEDIKFTPELEIDHVINIHDISLDLVEQVQRLAPFGPDNPPLDFMLPNLSLVSTSEIGVYGEHRQVVARDENNNEARIMWWNGGDQPPPEAQFDLLCRLSLSDYKGSRQISAEWVDYRISERGLEVIKQRHFQIMDRRESHNPLKEVIQFVQQNHDTLVWAEGDYPQALPGKGRTDLKPAKNLVIWTAPPSQFVLEAAIHKTKPEQIIVFSQNPNLNESKAFLQRLGGLVKFTIKHKNGKTTLNALASACAATKETIRFGLGWWEAMWKLSVDYGEEEITISRADQAADPEAAAIYRQLFEDSWKESVVFRSYFQKGELRHYLSGGKEVKV